jgi:predicted ester cyclase
MSGQPDADTTDQERNRRFVIEHFDEFVNNKDVDAVIRNMSEDFYDHDGPGGKPTDRAGDRALMEQMLQLLPDLRVQVVDSLAEGDKVVVRNIWTGTHAETGQRMEFHGFVLWRLAGGKIVERWATVTPLSDLAPEKLDW